MESYIQRYGPPAQDYHAAYAGPPGENRYGYDQYGVAVDPEELKSKGNGYPPPVQNYHAGYAGAPGENRHGYDNNGVAEDPEELMKKGYGNPPAGQHHHAGYAGSPGENQYGYDNNGVAVDPEELMKKGYGNPLAGQHHHVGYVGATDENRYGYDNNGVAEDPEALMKRGYGNPPAGQHHHAGYAGPPGQNRYGYDKGGVAVDPEELKKKGFGKPPAGAGYQAGHSGPPGENRFGYDQRGVVVDPEELAWKSKLLPANQQKSLSFAQKYGPSPLASPHKPGGVQWQEKEKSFMPGQPVDSIQNFMQQQQQQPAEPAGGYARLHKGQIPRMGRGLHAKDQVAPFGVIGGKDDQQSHYSPVGARRNNDALGHSEAGISGAHNRKDGQLSFEGYYGKAHAGKGQKSSLGNLENGIAGHAPVDALGQFQRLNQYSGVAAVMGSECMGSDPRGAHVSALRTYPQAKQGRDNLIIGHAGLTAQEGAEVPYRPILGHNGVGGRARGSSITAMAQGLASNDGIFGANSPAARLPHQQHYAQKQSSLINRDGGMMQAGEAAAVYNPFAGKTNASSLQTGDGGMYMKPSAPGPVQRHAGRITESSLMQKTNGISILPKDAKRSNSHGNDNWSTTHDNAYKGYQGGYQSNHAQYNMGVNRAGY